MQLGNHRPWKSLTALKVGNNCAHLHLLKVTVFTEGEPPVNRGITFWEHSTLKGNIKTLINVKVDGYLPGFKAWDIFQKVGLVVKLLIPSFWSFLSLGTLVIRVKAPVTVTSVATNDEGKGRLQANSRHHYPSVWNRAAAWSSVWIAKRVLDQAEMISRSSFKNVKAQVAQDIAPVGSPSHMQI